MHFEKSGLSEDFLIILLSFPLTLPPRTFPLTARQQQYQGSLHFLAVHCAPQYWAYLRHMYVPSLPSFTDFLQCPVAVASMPKSGCPFSRPDSHSSSYYYVFSVSVSLWKGNHSGGQHDEFSREDKQTWVRGMTWLEGVPNLFFGQLERYLTLWFC